MKGEKLELPVEKIEKESEKLEITSSVIEVGETHEKNLFQTISNRIAEDPRNVTVREIEILAEKGLLKSFEAISLLAQHAEMFRKQLEEKDKIITELKKEVMNNATEIQRLKEEVVIDELTGLHSRKYFFERLEEISNESYRGKSENILLMIDVDNFKEINDTYGHIVGDTALKVVASSFKEGKGIKQYDTAARYGGEEFAVILRFCDIENGKKVAERLKKDVEEKALEKLKKALEEKGIKIDLSGLKKITCSFGVAEIREKNPLVAIEKADAALYEAKNTGKNKVVVYEEEMTHITPRRGKQMVEVPEAPVIN